MREIRVNDNQLFKAEKIIRKNNDVVLIGAMQEVEGETLHLGNIMFPKLDNFEIIDGESFDLSAEDEKVLFDVDLDFRLSLLEMGVNANDL